MARYLGVAVTLAGSLHLATAGLEEIEHVVIFMQENRGKRGQRDKFFDGAAPAV